MIDHKTLLKKYIKYVIDVEGVDFISKCDRRCTSDIKFTDHEWCELNNLSVAGDKENNEEHF